jgi:hypothetical protein
MINLSYARPLPVAKRNQRGISAVRHGTQYPARSPAPAFDLQCNAKPLSRIEISAFSGRISTRTGNWKLQACSRARLDLTAAAVTRPPEHQHATQSPPKPPGRAHFATGQHSRSKGAPNGIRHHPRSARKVLFWALSEESLSGTCDATIGASVRLGYVMLGLVRPWSEQIYARFLNRPPNECAAAVSVYGT